MNLKGFPYRYIVLLLLVILSIFTFLDRVCMNMAAKYIKPDLNLNNEQFGLVLGAFSLAYALFEIPTGALGDRIGARKVLARIVVWWSAFTALTGAAFNLVYLIIIRFLFGIGEAGAYPNASLVLSRWFPAIEVGRAQSYIWAAARIGGSLTPLIVLPLISQFGWRLAFPILSSIGFVWAFVWFKWFRDNPSEKKGISQNELALIESSRIVKGHHKISWSVIIANRNIWVLMLMCHLFFYASYFFTNWSNVYFQEGRGLSETESKNFVSLSYFLGAIGCLIGGYLSDYLVKKRGLKFGRRFVGVIGLGFSSIFFMLAGLTTDNTLAGYLLAICVLTKDLALPVAFATCVDIGKQNAGTVAGSMNFAGQMGGFFITIIFGSIVQRTNDYNLPLFLISGCLVVAAILWFFIDPTKGIVEKGVKLN
jgi:MFS transporter, ACS family, glucarate transporter